MTPKRRRIVFQTGVPLTRLNGSVAVYNDTVDAAITTQYLADYNQFRERRRDMWTAGDVLRHTACLWRGDRRWGCRRPVARP